MLAMIMALTMGAPAAAMQLRTYAVDEGDFANPERGFWRSDRYLGQLRAENITLAHAYVRLDAYRDRPLPNSFLQQLQARFDAARAAGVKVVPRFTYNFPKGLPLAPGDGDAPLPVVQAHIAQLTPLLRRNADIIAYLEAGFVGAWGEWHDSTSGLDRTGPERAILQQLLRAMPRDRFVALRYERDKAAIFGRTTPATYAEILGQMDYGRVAHHDDCFLASEDGWATYRPADPASLERQKAFLSAENEHMPQGGETCSADAVAQPLIQCPNALNELARLHWSQINADYHPRVIALWRAQGCYGQIARRLGYRLRLMRVQLPKIVHAGGRLKGSIEIVNEGFASPYNVRPVELVLRRVGTARARALPLFVDPRHWSSGSARQVNIEAHVPKDVARGRYEVLLNLPDAAPALHGRPAYSIRLANKGTWEARTGYNRLLMRITVR